MNIYITCVAFVIGEEGIVPYIKLLYDGVEQINLLFMLDNRDILQLVTWMRDIIGWYLVASTLIRVIGNWTDILHGRFKIFNVSATTSGGWLDE